MEPLDRLAEAGESFATLLERTSTERPEAATPCSGWSVRQLAEHVVTGNRTLAAVLRGGPPADGSADLLGDDWAAAQRSAVGELVTELSRPGMIERLHRTPLGEVPGSVVVALRTVEHAVHGWDLAVATGQPTEPLSAIAEAVYEPSVGMLAQLPAGAHRPFAESRPVAPDRPSIERLVGLLGRDPGWRPDTA